MDYLFISVHDKSQLYFKLFMKKRYELAQQEKYLLGRILGDFLVSGIVMNFVFQTIRPKELLKNTFMVLTLEKLLVELLTKKSKYTME